jgi:hypothetical protein
MALVLFRHDPYRVVVHRHGEAAAVIIANKALQVTLDGFANSNLGTEVQRLLKCM